jgi:hypothetical protein
LDSHAAASASLANNGLSVGLSNIAFETLTQIRHQGSVGHKAAEVLGKLIIEDRFEPHRTLTNIASEFGSVIFYPTYGNVILGFST